VIIARSEKEIDMDVYRSVVEKKEPVKKEETEPALVRV
jgi:hypothetical protein